MKSDIIINFENLKNVINNDGKVDLQETEILIDFIEKYVKENDIDFIKLQNLLYKYREDGKITEEESEDLMILLDELPRRMKKKRIYKMMFRILIFGCSFSVILMYFYNMFKEMIIR